jgi:hypothetical protein
VLFSKEKSELTLVHKVFPGRQTTDVTIREAWQGVDEHLPLVWHIVAGRVPASYPPKAAHRKEVPGKAPAATTEEKKESNYKKKQKQRERRRKNNAAKKVQPKIV